MTTTVMEKILKRCNESVDVVAKKEIPDYLWKSCKGIAIITASEVGFVFSIQEGDGVVMKRNDDGTWGAPSAIMLTGCSGGFVIGKGHKRKFNQTNQVPALSPLTYQFLPLTCYAEILLFPMTEHGLKMLTANTKYQLGAQIGLAIGPHGREVSAALDAGGKGVGATFSYVFEDGLLLNAGINNNFIDTRAGVNQDFYGKEASGTDIVFEPGTVDIPEDKGVEELHAKLSALSQK